MVFYTKLFYAKAKLIRRPFYLRNEGKFIFERGLSLGPSSLIEIFGCKSKLIIGKNFSAYVNLHIGCCNHISIGDNVLVASNVYISDHLHGFYKNIDSSLISDPRTEPLKGKYLPIQSQLVIMYGLAKVLKFYLELILEVVVLSVPEVLLQKIFQKIQYVLVFQLNLLKNLI